MGIKSRVRIEYWQNSTKVSTGNTMLYPGGSDIVSEANIDASEYAAFAHGFKAAWNFASGSASMANGNFVSAGFSLESLAGSINDLKNVLADKTLVRGANLNIAYPHPLFNTIRLVFEAQSTEDFFGDKDAPEDVGHAPSLMQVSPVIQFESSGGRFDRTATYIIKLDELNVRMAASRGRFFSRADDLQPLVFQFAVKEKDVTSTARSVLHTLALNIFRQHEEAPMAYTDIVYWTRRPGDELAQVVAWQRLMEFSPRIEPMMPSLGNEFQFAEVPLVLDNGNFVVEGKPYDFVSLIFSVVSRRKHNGVRPLIDLTASYVPISGGTPLGPHVTYPTLSPGIDQRGQLYLAEGIGSACIVISPAEVSPGTMVFGAGQEPGGWTTQQDVRLFRVLREIQAEPVPARTVS